MNKRLFRILLLPLALCTGCAEQAYQAYGGVDKSSKELAVIKPSSRDVIRGVHAEILGVDDDYFDGSEPEMVDILPGKHSVLIRCRRGGIIVDENVGFQEREGSVEFIAQAGREYIAFCGTDDYKFVRWIADPTTGEIVGGDKPITPR
jgi:hypothetical protein